MKKNSRSFPWLLLFLSILLPGCLAVAVEYDAQIPRLAFAAQEIKNALKEAGREDLNLTLIVKADESSPESFQIRTIGPSKIEVSGSDESGAMYGGLEVANLLRLALPIENQERAPFIKKRGLKVNIPWDCRTPSYCDKGSAAQNNIVNVWDFDGFWKPYFDDMARYRYNVLSLWSTHAYPNLVKVPGYEDCAMPDVYRVREDLLHPKFDGKIRPDLDANGDGEVTPEDGTMTLVKRMSIDEKMAHWKKVFQHAEDRGIEIYLFHWDVYVNGSEGKYGITPEQTNPKTIAYVRASVKETLLTYPQIKGIGVTSGEDDRRELDGTSDSTENYIYKTYGLGIMDAQADPKWKDRNFRFIFRRHGTEYDWAKDAMKNYTGGVMDTSTKYSVAHMYSSRRPQEWERRIVGEDWLNDYKAWLNLRNDDIFMHRFGSPDYAREFIKNMPHEHIRGFYMGSDGYFWGRDLISKEPEMAGQLEIDKHWYNFRMFGEMAYNNDLDDNYWKAVLKYRFPSVDADLLFNAWETVSEVVPQLNRAAWAATDGDFAPEMCQGDSFLSMDNYYFDRNPMVLRKPPPAGEERCISVSKWAEAVVAGKMANPNNQLTPLEVADNLDGFAQTALDALPTLEARIGDNVELKETLLDIRSMAYLGQYYADKQRCAAKLMVYRLGGRQDDSWHKQAVKHIEDSREHWKQVADILESHYKTSLHAKTGWFRWYETLKLVEDEVQRIKGEGALPVIDFVGLADGDTFKAGDSLEVKVNATAVNGVTEVKLYLNGLVLNDPEGNNPYVWNDSTDNLLKDMRQDWYSLEAVAVDRNGFVKRKDITINVGRSSGDKEDWKFETYAVILTDGKEFTSDKDDEVTVQLDKLEAKFQFDSSGKIKLRDDFLGVNVFKSRSKVDPGPRRLEFKDGAITTYNLIEPVSVLWSSKIWDANNQTFKKKSPAMDGYKGPFEFVVTRSKKLAVTGMKDGKRKVAWHEDPNYEDWTGRFEQGKPDTVIKQPASISVSQGMKRASGQAGVLIGFFPDSKVRPKNNPYPLTITGLGGTPPSVSTTDPSKDIPGLTGSFRDGDGSFVLTIDGRSDDTTNWFADTWSGGASHPVKGSEAGLGIADTVGAQKVNDGEAIIWSFDLSLLNLAPGKSLVMTAADFGGMDEGEHAKFWRLTGNAGSSGAGTLLSTGGSWTGEITISDHDEFAFTDDGRLRSVTFNIASDASNVTENPDEEDLAAVAGEKTGNTGQREIPITVGYGSENNSTTSKDEIHQVILNE